MLLRPRLLPSNKRKLNPKMPAKKSFLRRLATIDLPSTRLILSALTTVLRLLAEEAVAVVEVVEAEAVTVLMAEIEADVAPVVEIEVDVVIAVATEEAVVAEAAPELLDQVLKEAPKLIELRPADVVIDSKARLAKMLIQWTVRMELAVAVEVIARAVTRKAVGVANQLIVRSTTPLPKRPRDSQLPQLRK